MMPSNNNQMPGVDANGKHNNTGEPPWDGMTVLLTGCHAPHVASACIPRPLRGGSLSGWLLGILQSVGGVCCCCSLLHAFCGPLDATPTAQHVLITPL
jgi:hypothetical protein